MNRREFMQMLAVAAAGGMTLHSNFARAEKAAESLYDLPPFGNVSLLHMTDCHAQLLPIYFREPNVNLGIGGMRGNAPHIVGDGFLKHFGIKPGSIEAYAFTYLDFVEAKKLIGDVLDAMHISKQISYEAVFSSIDKNGDSRISKNELVAAVANGFV